MIRPLPLTLLALLGACARAAPTEPSGPREGWLHEVALPLPMRPASACERAAAVGPEESARDADDGIARVIEADLDGDGRRERAVIAMRRGTVVALTDAQCTPRFRGGFDPDAAEMVGPSPGPDPWAQVPDAEVSRLYANDTLALGGTLQAYLVRGEGAHRHVILVQTGSLGRLRYGWRALVLGCHEGACRGSLIGHAERAAIPAGLGCGLTFRTYRPPPDAELPMLRVAPGSSPGALVLTPHARVRDTCGVAPETVRALAPFHLAP